MDYSALQRVRLAPSLPGAVQVGSGAAAAAEEAASTGGPSKVEETHDNLAPDRPALVSPPMDADRPSSALNGSEKPDVRPQLPPPSPARLPPTTPPTPPTTALEVAPTITPVGCAEMTKTLLPVLEKQYRPESCRTRATRGDNIVLERMLRFAKDWDDAHPGSKPFFCDIMVGGPKGLFSKWRPDYTYDAKKQFRWADIVSSQPINSTRAVTIQFTGGKQFCEMFRGPDSGFERVTFPVIVVGPMGDDSNWGPFSGGKFSPYFRYRDINANFESHVCGRGSWARVVDFLEDDRVLLWVTFSQNLEHPKLVSLPLAAGAKFAPRALARYQESLLIKKTHLIGLTFGDGYNSRTEWRAAVFESLQRLQRFGHGVQESGINPFHIADPTKSREDGWVEALRTFQTSKLIISPGGYGVDTKRPFEALLTGAVPLHLRNGLYKTYRGLPVVFTDDYHLNATSFSYASAACMKSPRFEKLTWSGWIGFIQDVQAGRAHVEDW